MFSFTAYTDVPGTYIFDSLYNGIIVIDEDDVQGIAHKEHVNGIATGQKESRASCKALRTQEAFQAAPEGISYEHLNMLLPGRKNSEGSFHH